MTYPVKLRSVKDVRKLNEIASKQDFPMYVSDKNGTVFVDARSLLALFALVGRNINLVAPDHVNADDFLKVVRSLG